MPAIQDGKRVEEQAIKLIQGCRVLDVPILVTEQYPSGLGETVPGVAQALGQGVQPVDKVRFSACVEPVLKRLQDLQRSTILICGVESHVCVLQTALDLVGSQWTPAVVWDAVGSRYKRDYEISRDRLQAAGVMPLSVEMALLEMVQEAGTDRFKAILPLLK